MRELVHLLEHYGVALIFLNVFLEQIGLPIPAVPALIVEGAMTSDGRFHVASIFPAAIAASLLADAIWFVLGRRLGHRVLRILCRISLSPDSCVRQTESFFGRWGMTSLLFAKFVPGFSTVAPPLAGASKRSNTAVFLFFDATGGAIWAGAAIAIGRVFHRQIGRLLEFLQNFGFWAVLLVAFLVLLFILVKWNERRRFYQQLRMARIGPDALNAMMQEKDVVVIDARSSHARQAHGYQIPGAITVTPELIGQQLARLHGAEEIVVYCT
jgi:membrane protein DedA with SNARE-associated domain